MDFLSEKMSRLLSSLAPGFEGHYDYYEIEISSDLVEVRCREKQNSIFEEPGYPGELICPAWQVEDVLKNLDKLNGEFCKVYPSEIAEKIAKCFFFYSPDTAYQKIEEYLWMVLK